MAAWSTSTRGGNPQNRIFSPNTTFQNSDFGSSQASKRHRVADMLSLPIVNGRVGYTATYRKSMNLDSSRFKQSIFVKGTPWADEAQEAILAQSDTPQEKILTEDRAEGQEVQKEGTNMSDKVIKSS